MLPNFSSRNWWKTWIFLTRFSFPTPVSFFRWKLKAIPETEFKHIIKQKSKKVKIRIISEVNEENMKEAEWLSRYVKLGLQRTPLRLIVIDKNEVLIDTSKDSFEKEALLTKSREWVDAFQGVFDLIWSISTPFKKP